MSNNPVVRLAAALSLAMPAFTSAPARAIDTGDIVVSSWTTATHGMSTGTTAINTTTTIVVDGVISLPSGLTHRREK